MIVRQTYEFYCLFDRLQKFMSIESSELVNLSIKARMCLPYKEELSPWLYNLECPITYTVEPLL